MLRTTSSNSLSDVDRQSYEQTTPKEDEILTLALARDDVTIWRGSTVLPQVQTRSRITYFFSIINSSTKRRGGTQWNGSTLGWLGTRELEWAGEFEVQLSFLQAHSSLPKHVLLATTMANG